MKANPKLRDQKRQYDFFVLEPSMKKKVQRVFHAIRKRLIKETDLDRIHKLNILKSEFSKLIDQL